MVWGYGGVLSLGQGVFFGLGGYAMAMFLKLEASDPETTKIQSTPGIPDFMDWNQITELPTFWLPFKSLPLTLILVIAVPTDWRGWQVAVNRGDSRDHRSSPWRWRRCAAGRRVWCARAGYDGSGRGRRLA